VEMVLKRGTIDDGKGGALLIIARKGRCGL